jgi:hypothetical protein
MVNFRGLLSPPPMTLCVRTKKTLCSVSTPLQTALQHPPGSSGIPPGGTRSHDYSAPYFIRDDTYIRRITYTQPCTSIRNQSSLSLSYKLPKRSSLVEPLVNMYVWLLRMSLVRSSDDRFLAVASKPTAINRPPPLNAHLHASPS